MQIIPFKEPSQWREQILIDNMIYNIRCKWNALNEYWTMDLLDSSDIPIVVGVKIVANYNLLQQYVMTAKPLGDIVCQSIIGSNEKIGRYDMSRATELIYFIQGELDELSASLTEA
jgi:hypothetical protein